MLFSRAMVIACLTVLAWALILIAALLVLLLVVQQIRGDPGAQPDETAIGAAVALAFALGCRALARRFL